MQRLLITSLLVILGLFIPTTLNATNSHKLIGSVTTLGVEGDPFCTASSINEKKRYWLTAAHCVSDDTETLLILDEAVTVLVNDIPNDLAILSTPTKSLPRLKLAKNGPTYGDRVVLVGYNGPMQMRGPILTFGWVSHPSIVVFQQKGWTVPYMILQIPGAPGHSGSPVVNTQDEIVSVLQWGWSKEWGPVGGGVVFAVLEAYRSYWE